MLTKIMGVIHARIHALARFGRMSMTGIASDKYTIVLGIMRSDSLAD